MTLATVLFIKDYEKDNCNWSSSSSCGCRSVTIQKDKEIKVILRKLEKQYKFVTIERILELPLGTLEKWKNGKIPADGKALIRILNIHPELMLRVADNGYKDTDKILVDEILIKPEIREQERIENKKW